MARQRKKAFVVGASDGALLIGAVAAIGLGAIVLMSGRKRVQAMAAQTGFRYSQIPSSDLYSQESIEQMLFTAVLDNADRPATVLKNEDRITEAIKRLRPQISELKKQHEDGRIDAGELKQELKALTLPIHEDLGIPTRPGPSVEKRFHPDREDYPAKYGHRNKRWKQKRINHGGSPREDPGCDCLPTTTDMMANSYPAHKVGHGNKKDDDWDPPGFNRGWELGRGNPHDDNTIPIVPRPPHIPKGHHYGWEKGVGNPHGDIPYPLPGPRPDPRPFPGKGKHLGWERGVGNPHGVLPPFPRPGRGRHLGWAKRPGHPHYLRQSLHVIAHKPFKGKGHHYGWTRGVGNPHNPTNAGIGRDHTHGQNSLPPGWRKVKKFKKAKKWNHHRLANAVVTEYPLDYPI